MVRWTPMFPRRLFVPIIVAILSSCTTARPVPEPPATKPAVAPSGGVVGVTADGTILVVREGSSVLESWKPGAAAAERRIELPAPAAGVRARGDVAIVTTADGTILVARDGSVRTFEAALDLAGEEQVARRPGGIAFAGGQAVRVPGTIRTARLLPSGTAIVLARDGDGESLFHAKRGERDAARIAGPFPEIDSFDVAPDGTEVAFSARRDGGFDVGLVAVEGSEVRWIGPDPLDERMVRWAPRGNKIAFAIETPAGAVARSVHIPTAFQLSAPLPMARIRDLAWDAPAERLAILLTSADAAERVEMMRFDGTERRTAVPPAMRSEGAEQLAGIPGAMLFNPESVRYNEKLPLVIWEAAAGAFVFHEGRARVQQNRRIGSVVLSRGATEHPRFWDAIAELGWVDPRNVFIVADAFAATAAIPGGIRATVLTRESGAGSTESVTIVRSEPGSLEDFAVLWLGERLRGFEREHDGN